MFGRKSVVNEDGKDMTRMSVVDVGEPERSGWLTKQGAIVKSWKRRYFVLKDGFLYYFKSENAESPQGVIEVDKMNTVKSAEDTTGTAFCFELSVPGRVYLLVAEDKDDLQAWLRALGRAIVMRSSVKLDDDQ